ncbi:MAG: ABC transporter ATP-binding protein [Gaiellales bacterium]
MTSLLELRSVSKVYGGGASTVVALQDFELIMPEAPARVVTIAGESGSGKSTIAGIVLGFVAPTSGDVRFRGHDLRRLPRRERIVYRRHVQAVFQDPYGVFNPFYRVSHVFDLVFKKFKLARTGAERSALLEESLAVVGLDAGDVLGKYPHQLSGGQRQRLMMARAYILKPDLIIADEPVSMVDASLRASILDIMRRMRDEDGISFLYITHDLSTAYQIGDEVHVLYQGSVVERGQTSDVLERPMHPYVQALVASIPEVERRWEGEIVANDDESLRRAVDSGCRFAPRCPHRLPVCGDKRPVLLPPTGETRDVACYLHSREHEAVGV